MSEISKRRLALACCAALAFAVAACEDDGPGTSSSSGSKCGDAVCGENQECIDNVCKDKTDPSDPCSQCTGDQKCEDGKCVANDPSDPCSQCTDDQTCKDGKCVAKDPSDPCSKCTSDQTCENGVCKDKTGEDPCAKCTDGQKCVDKVCTDLCGDAICGSNYACVDDECVKLCGGVLCKDGQICDKSSQTCIDKPTDVDPCDLCSDTEECVDGVCKPLDPCANKICPDNWRCDSSKNGACVEIDPCESVVCLADQTCVAAHCIDNDCLEGGVEKDCGEGKVCSKGACVDDGCEGKTCDDGWQCIKGICEETVCIGYFCEEGRSCRGGACVDNECLDMVCGEGKVCSKGDCIYTQCVGKDPCPTGKRCNFNGECEYIELPKIIIDEPEDKTTDEDGKTLTLGLHLNNAPSSEVRISCEVLTESPNKEVEVSCDEIVFNADNWQLEQSIIVTGVADYLKDGDQTYKIKVTTTSEEVDFEELTAESVELTNIDTTKPGFVISETSLLTYEDQEQPPATFTVQLASIPTATVSLGLGSSNTAEGTVSPTVLKFTKDNWNEPQTVTVKGVDDNKSDGNVNYKVFFADAESNDLSYNEMKVDSIKVTNVDNDVPGISMNLDPEGFVLNEGQMYPLKIKLNTQPDKDVKVTMSVDDETEVEFDKKEVTLTPETWKDGADVQISGVADHIIDGDQPAKVTFKVTSDDEQYNLPKDIEYSGKVVDVDIADILVAMGDSPIVREGSNDAVTMSLTLASKPTKEVKVAVSLENEAELKLNKKEVTFKPEYWDLPQDVTVYSVDDNIVDGDTRSKVRMALTSGDANFQGKTKEVEFTTVDDDVAGLVVVSSPATFPENSGSSTTMTVALKAQPLKDVKVSVTSSNKNELAVTSASTLTFTAANWDKPQPVTVQVVDDNAADGTQTAYVMFACASEDSNFNGIKEQSANYTILDNDSVSVALAVDPMAIASNSPTATATVSLGSQPSADVTVTLKADHASIFSFNKAPKFTKDNWNTPQSVTVTVNFSNVNSAMSTETIYAVASGADYAGIQSNKVSLTLNKIVQTLTYDYTGKVQSVDLPAGRYKLEVWGAQGGGSQQGSASGGKGGYSVGIVSLSASTKVYVYVGGAGLTSTGSDTSASWTGGFNGGGTAEYSGYGGGSGGGASDIRIATDSLYSRVIVAGGGGGAGYKYSNTPNGGVGGGTNGGNGVSDSYGCGGGGSQIAGGAPGYEYNSYYKSGTFGVGANSHGWSWGGAAGGGGWYGGGSSFHSGGGGSGWVYTASSYSTWKSGNSTDAGKYTLNSNYYLTSQQTIAGNAKMPAPKGGDEIGHAGNGYVRISLQ